MLVFCKIQPIAFFFVLGVLASTVSPSTLVAIGTSGITNPNPPATKSEIHEADKTRQEPHAGNQEPTPIIKSQSPTSQLKATKSAKQCQNKTNNDSSGTGLLTVFNALLVLATFLLFFVGLKQANATNMAAVAATKANQIAEQSLRTTQRAYVEISHTDGLLQVTDTMYEINLVITNIGQTPAIITEILFDSDVRPVEEELPDPPQYGPLARRTDIPPSLSRGAIVSSSHKVGHTPEAVAAINAGTHTLIIFARIRYTDAFGVHHEAGYGRRYDPSASTNQNLLIIPHHAYNYDRPRKNGEGESR